MAHIPATTTSLWRATAEPVTARAPLKGETRADVVVIGGGMMGAVTALTLARGGASVVLLEATRIGEEASSRPGGFVVPHFTFAGPSQAISTLGAVGERMVQAVGHSASRVYDLIREHDISCDARQGGWYQPAAGSAAFDRIRAVAADWQAHGFRAEILDGEETRQRTGVAGYNGSWTTPTGGTIHPLNYTIGLARAAELAGARIHETSPATGIRRQNSLFEVTTPAGTVTANRVIVCTNAQSRGLAPKLEQSVVRMKIWQCATAPIPEHERAHLFRNGESLSDTRGNLFTYRFDRDWRLITGSVSAFGVPADMAGQAMARRLAKMLGLTQTPALDYLWSGQASVTRSRLPEIVLDPNGLIAACACNGRGIALTTVLGEAIAKAVLSDNFDNLPAPVTTPTGGLEVLVQQQLGPFYPYYSLVTDWLAERR